MITAIQPRFLRQGVAAPTGKAHLNVRFGNAHDDGEESVGHMPNCQNHRPLRAGEALFRLQHGPRQQADKVPALLIGRRDELTLEVLNLMLARTSDPKARKFLQKIAKDWAKGKANAMGLFRIDNNDTISRTHGVIFPSTGSPEQPHFPYLDVSRNGTLVQLLPLGPNPLGLLKGERLPIGSITTIPAGTVLRLASKTFTFTPLDPNVAPVEKPPPISLKDRPEALFRLLDSSGDPTGRLFTFAEANSLLGMSSFSTLLFGTDPSLSNPKAVDLLRQRLAQKTPEAQALFKPSIEIPRETGRFVLAGESYPQERNQLSDVHIATGLKDGRCVFLDTSHYWDGLKNETAFPLQNKTILDFLDGTPAFLSGRARITFPSKPDGDERKPSEPTPKPPALVSPVPLVETTPPIGERSLFGQFFSWVPGLGGDRRRRKAAKPDEPKSQLPAKAIGKVEPRGAKAIKPARRARVTPVEAHTHGSAQTNGVGRKRVHTPALTTKPPKKRRKLESAMA